MEVKPTKENITIGALMVAIAGGVYAMEDRYVTLAQFGAHLHDPIYVQTPAFDTHVAFSEIRALENRLELLQNKLAALLAMPEADRAHWQREEIERLRSEIQRVRDKISRLG